MEDSPAATDDQAPEDVVFTRRIATGGSVAGKDKR